jgi:hypothetical protein
MKIAFCALVLALLYFTDPDLAELLRRLPESNDDFAL